MKISKKTNNRNHKKLIPLKEASRFFGYSKDSILYLAKKGDIKIVKKDLSFFIDFDSLNEYRKNHDEYFKREISKDWRKKKKTKRLVHDIIHPVRKDIIKVRESIVKKVKFTQKKVSVWTKVFYLFLKTSKYGSAIFFFGIVLFGGILSWAISPKIEIVEIYPTVYEGDWNNMDRALERNMSEDSDLDSFRLGGSATINIFEIESEKENIEVENQEPESSAQEIVDEDAE